METARNGTDCSVPIYRNGAFRSSAKLPSCPTPMSGRKAEAARNDRAILDAAREVFMREPGAPILAVALRAGVGVGALYRRYASKEVLLQTLCADGLRQFIAIAEGALAADVSPAAAFTQLPGGHHRLRRARPDRGAGRHVHPDRGTARARGAGRRARGADLRPRAGGRGAAPRSARRPTCRCCSSRSRRSGWADLSARRPCGAGTWPCCWTRCGRRRPWRHCRARRRPPRSSRSAGGPAATAASGGG